MTTVSYLDIMMIMFVPSFINYSLYSEIGIHLFVQSVFAVYFAFPVVEYNIKEEDSSIPEMKNPN